MRVNLNTMPSRPTTYVQDFNNLTGGLNIQELDYRLKPGESPNMRNLWWDDGVLQCRDGQRYIQEEEVGTGFTCVESPFWGNIFFHIGDKIYYGNPDDASFQLTELVGEVPENRGTFFRYLDWLFYKNRGGFLRISYDPEADPVFKAEKAEDFAYTPVILLNAHPENSSGDTYQPENRLSPKKTVRYNASKDVKEYHLPVQEIDSVDKVLVDGAEKKETTDYTVDKAKGIVTFVTAPPVTNPATNNTVEITYSKANADAQKSIMDCIYAFTSGAGRELCILLAGSTEQPNAVFWNANDNLSMNPTYFPMTNYNLVGDTADPVSGFGRQYSDTIVLKEHSVGKLEFSIEQVDGRDSISFTYTNINDKTGCDLPWSVQLIENNLVFCNTYQGVHVIRSSSAAYENNVECISQKVNGSAAASSLGYRFSGLLKDTREAEIVSSHDDGYRYWLCAGGNCYLWDYYITNFSDPSWFFQTNINPVCFFQDSTNRTYHLDAKGRVTRFGRFFTDYGEAIDKLYQFPVMNFGAYDRLKDVIQVILATRSDTETQIKIQYDTDYETRADLTEIYTWAWTWKNLDLGIQILGYYNLEAPRYARVAKRKPGCRHIRHFTMTLSNASPGEDLAVVSAQVFYRFQGRER